MIALKINYVIVSKMWLNVFLKQICENHYGHYAHSDRKLLFLFICFIFFVTALFFRTFFT